MLAGSSNKIPQPQSRRDDAGFRRSADAGQRLVPYGRSNSPSVAENPLHHLFCFCYLPDGTGVLTQRAVTEGCQHGFGFRAVTIAALYLSLAKFECLQPQTAPTHHVPQFSAAVSVLRYSYRSRSIGKLMQDSGDAATGGITDSSDAVNRL